MQSQWLAAPMKEQLRRCLLVICLIALPTGIQASASHRLLVLGDSLSAAYGFDVNYGWVALLDDYLSDQGFATTVVNASISGETTGGGLARLPELLSRYPADAVIIELGGNNGLLGQPLEALRTDLLSMIHIARQHGASVLLLGMEIPPNYGGQYTRRFAQTYIDIAQQETIPLVPFFLADLAHQEGMLQADGIHPTVLAQPLMLEAVLPYLLPLLPPASSTRDQRP